MSTLHWHPFLGEWVIVSGNRQARPNLPKDHCPFCPGSPKVPASYEAISVANDFPSLSLDSPGTGPDSGMFLSAPARGVCEVVLYSSVHEQTFSTLGADQVDKVIGLWTERYRALGAMKEIRAVFIFENKGQVVGATIPHPHGQIYAFGFLPPRMERELKSQEEYLREKGSCLGCALAREEAARPERVVALNQGWVASVPWHARYPYEVQILPRRHLGSLAEMRGDERDELNAVLREVTRRYDGLFGFPLPYMMLQHARPTDGGEYPYHHFRISFLPLHRAADKLKYIAGCETGAGTYITDMDPEWAAGKLKEVRL